ncbi:hypothetical protein M885DRAFT_622347 [Pelagophyceae sp. CCMP2097]|nr:hypothetical protein M885DRAFT_622347 [Pelagophyceae sp. CCMP2097]|mmetsp:Transcript_24378/g.87099  ORF Transcript_24378/g.87099 Transcript_24378/m.87099 type:complete len:523 (+) Transcript_24378:162-1730(+)
MASVASRKPRDAAAHAAFSASSARRAKDALKRLDQHLRQEGLHQVDYSTYLNLIQKEKRSYLSMDEDTELKLLQAAIVNVGMASVRKTQKRRPWDAVKTKVRPIYAISKIIEEVQEAREAKEALRRAANPKLLRYNSTRTASSQQLRVVRANELVIERRLHSPTSDDTAAEPPPHYPAFESALERARDEPASSTATKVLAHGSALLRPADHLTKARVPGAAPLVGVPITRAFKEPPVEKRVFKEPAASRASKEPHEASPVKGPASPAYVAARRSRDVGAHRVHLAATQRPSTASPVGGAAFDDPLEPRTDHRGEKHGDKLQHSSWYLRGHVKGHGAEKGHGATENGAAASVVSPARSVRQARISAAAHESFTAAVQSCTYCCNYVGFCVKCASIANAFLAGPHSDVLADLDSETSRDALHVLQKAQARLGAPTRLSFENKADEAMEKHVVGIFADDDQRHLWLRRHEAFFDEKALPTEVQERFLERDARITFPNYLDARDQLNAAPKVLLNKPKPIRRPRTR